MPWHKGQPKAPGSGRKKGTPNKFTTTARELIQRLGVNPLEVASLIVQRRVPCGTCIDEHGKPTGMTAYRLADKTHARDCDIYAKSGGTPVCTCLGYGRRKCESCFGTKWERINVGQLLQACELLAKYCYPTFKSIEVSGIEEKPIQHMIQVTYLAPGQQRKDPPTPSADSARASLGGLPERPASATGRPIPLSSRYLPAPSRGGD